MSDLKPLEKGEMPEPLPLKKLIGPSFILLGLGLGSGELILWPYLSSLYGMGIIWAAVIGITLQFFLNMEIARYTLVNGESIFVGLTRKYGIIAPYWFIISTLLPWMWPGIIASSTTLFTSALGIEYSPLIASILLILIGLILSLGKIIYKTQESFQKVIILIGIPFIFILAFLFAKPAQYSSLLSGLIGKGEGYWFLPLGINFATLLGALAYAGAGGNLNLSQSYYVKEKGYGMGKYTGRISGLINSKNEEIRLEGTTFLPTPENLKNFGGWWKKINVEHFLVFWFTGALTMIVLSLLAYSTVFANPNVKEGLGFIITEGVVIAEKTFPWLGSAFMLTAAVMLFGTQFSVFASTSRIMSENIVLINRKRFPVEKISKYFYFFLWLQITAGVLIFTFGSTQPLTLIITSAVLNAITMFIYSGLVYFLNTTKLPAETRPNLLRRLILIFAFLFYGGFSVFTIIQYL